MASESNNRTSQGLSLDEIRHVRAKRRTELAQIKAAMEEPADKIYSYNISIGLDTYQLRFKRWTHDQANLLREQPLYLKLLEKRELSKEEKARYDAIRIEMIFSAIEDKDRWRNKISEQNMQLVEEIYRLISMVSMNNEYFRGKMREYYESEEGYAYGHFWYFIQGKLSHEIGSLPDSSVIGVNEWLSIWGDRVRQQ